MPTDAVQPQLQLAPVSPVNRAHSRNTERLGLYVRWPAHNKKCTSHRKSAKRAGKELVLLAQGQISVTFLAQYEMTTASAQLPKCMITDEAKLRVQNQIAVVKEFQDNCLVGLHQ